MNSFNLNSLKYPKLSPTNTSPTHVKETDGGKKNLNALYKQQRKVPQRTDVQQAVMCAHV